MWSSSPLGLSSIPGELQKVEGSLQKAVDQFSRQLAKESVRHAPRARGVAKSPQTKLPAPRGGRPMAHPLASPHRPRKGTVKTVLDRQREREAQRRGGRPAFAVAVEQGADRVAQAIRERLLALRGRLGALRSRTGGQR